MLAFSSLVDSLSVLSFALSSSRDFVCSITVDCVTCRSLNEISPRGVVQVVVSVCFDDEYVMFSAEFIRLCDVLRVW